MCARERPTIRQATEADLPAVHRVVKWTVRDLWANFETADDAIESVERAWRDSHAMFPWLVAETPGEGVLGYAAASRWKPKNGYDWTCETTVYVLPQGQGRGAGRALYERLIAVVRAQGYRLALGGIALPNEPSVRLHESLGYVKTGVFEKVGWVDGEWRDVGYWALRMAGDDAPLPVRPVEEAMAGIERAREGG